MSRSEHVSLYAWIYPAYRTRDSPTSFFNNALCTCIEAVVVLMTSSPSSPPSPAIPPLHFPPSSAPRTWLITSATSAIGLRVAKHALAHGDNVIGGFRNPALVEGIDGWDESMMEYDEFEASMGVHTEAGQAAAEAAGKGGATVNGERKAHEWAKRWRSLEWDGRKMAQCQAAVAEAENIFGGADILFCCESEALIGTVEELSLTPTTLSLIRTLFETNFYGPVNNIKAALPSLRRNNGGHIVVLSSVANHLGTPTLPFTCSAGWALDGFCDSLSYEIAPFDIKLSILQMPLEAMLLSNKIVAAPALPSYTPSQTISPLPRYVIGGLIDRIEGNTSSYRLRRTASEAGVSAGGVGASGEITGTYNDNAQQPQSGSSALDPDPNIERFHPLLSSSLKSSLLAETVHAVLAIAGHDNPPNRHIIGYEGVAGVKEKLKATSEELEEFVGVSCAVDVESGDGAEEGEGPDGGEGEEDGDGMDDGED